MAPRQLSAHDRSMRGQGLVHAKAIRFLRVFMGETVATDLVPLQNAALFLQEPEAHPIVSSPACAQHLESLTGSACIVFKFAHLQLREGSVGAQQRLKRVLDVWRCPICNELDYRINLVGKHFFSHNWVGRRRRRRRGARERQELGNVDSPSPCSRRDWGSALELYVSRLQHGSISISTCM